MTDNRQDVSAQAKSTALLADDRALLASMLDATSAGAEQAFLTLYRRRQAGLHRFALRMTGSHDAAEDAVQETFLALIRLAANYDPTRGSVSAFLYGIARNCVLRGLERNGKLLAVGLGGGNDEMESLLEHQARTSATDLPEHPMDCMSRAEEVEALRRAIITLPEHYRAAVILCDLEELSYEEAAAALDCAVGTVRSRLHRARGLLAERLKHLTAEVTEDAEAMAKDRTSLAGKAIRPLECEA